VSVWAARGRRPPPRFEVAATRGAALVEGRRYLRWRDDAGDHIERSPRHAPARVLLERFVRMVRTGRRPRPALADAYRALLVLRAARTSLAEGRPIDIPAPRAEAS
jgi:predicted dehydrogenase